MSKGKSSKSTASSAGDESVLAEDNETSNDAEQGSDEEDDEEDADEREMMMKLIKARAVHIIAAAHEGKFEPRGGLAALTEQVRTNRLSFVRGFKFIILRAMVLDLSAASSGSADGGKLPRGASRSFAGRRG